ncbi:MAG: hypothetical protein AAB759_00695, partial [Patescibacteria group bacterium]
MGTSIETGEITDATITGDDVNANIAGGGLVKDTAATPDEIDVGAGFGITVNTDDIAIATSTNFTWGGTHTFSATTTMNGHLALSGDANEGLSGGGLTDCDLETQTLNWDAGTNKFLCLADAGAGAGASNLQEAYVGGNIIDITSAEGALDIQAVSANFDILVGSSTDTGDFRIWDGTNNWFFADESAGTISLGGAAFGGITIATSTTFTAHLTLSGDANEGLSGGGLADCDASNQRLQWDITTSKFSCLTVASSLPQMVTAQNTNNVTWADADTTDLWATLSELQITVAANSEVLVLASFYTTAVDPGNNPVSLGVRIDQEGAGIVSDCADTNNVNIFSGTYTDTAAGDPAVIISGSTAFVDSGTSAGGTFTYAVCTEGGSTAIGGGTWVMDVMELTLYEVNDAGDLAEIYPTGDESITSGEVVSIDSTLPGGIRRTASAYDDNILGVIATKPAMVMGSTGGKGIDGKPVALAGRVPVRVTTENGEIQPGDKLTSSGVPGVAMKATKAGPILGIALEEYREDVAGTIIAFVKTGYFTGSNLKEILEGEDEISEKDLGKSVLLRLTKQKERLTASSTLSEIFTDRVAAALEVISPRGLFDGLEVNTIGALADAVTFTSDTIFFGRPYFNADTAGFAVIKSGDRKADVVFEKEYLEQPVVNASISSEEDSDIFDENILANNINFIITKKTAKGFSIVLNKPAPQDIKFSWITLAVKSAKTFSSKPFGTDLTPSINSPQNDNPPHPPSVEEPPPQSEPEEAPNNAPEPAPAPPLATEDGDTALPAE